MKRLLTILLISLAVITVVVTIYYEFGYKKNYSKNKVIELLINDVSEGKIGDYEFEISQDCKTNLFDATYDLTNSGYYKVSFKEFDSPQYYIITSGSFKESQITKLSLLNSEFIIDVREISIDNSFTNPTCIKITKNGGSPNITGITIKNQNGNIYDELNNQGNTLYSVGDEGVIIGTKIKYKISKNCQFKEKDLSIKGYYLETFNQPNSPYYYLISAGENPNGCYGISVDNILYDKGNLTINVQFTSPSVDDTCTDALVYPHICVEINDIGDHNVTINNIIADDILEQLQLLK